MAQQVVWNGGLVRQSQNVEQAMPQVDAVNVLNSFMHFLRIPECLSLPIPPDLQAVLNEPKALQNYIQSNKGGKYDSYFTDQLSRYEQLSAILQDPKNPEAITLCRHLCALLKGEVDNSWKKNTNPHEKVVAYALLATNIATLPVQEKEQCQATLVYSRNLYILERLAEKVSSNLGNVPSLTEFKNNPGVESAVNNLMLYIIKADAKLSIDSISKTHKVSTLDIVMDRVSAFYKAGMPITDQLGAILAFTLLARTDNLDYFNLAHNARNFDLSAIDSKVNFNFLAREATDQKSHINYMYLLNPRDQSQANLLLRLLNCYSQRSNNNFNFEPSQEVKEAVQLAVMRVFVRAVEFDPKVAHVPGLKQAVWKQFLHRGRFCAKSGVLADKLLHEVTPQQDIEAIKNSGFLATAVKLADLQGLTGGKRVMEIGKLLLAPWMIASVKNRLT